MTICIKINENSINIAKINPPIGNEGGDNGTIYDSCLFYIIKKWTCDMG